jgi:hypothetical protein
LLVCLVEFVALSWDASSYTTRRGVVIHLAGAGPMLSPLGAFAVGAVSGALAGRGTFGYLRDRWQGFPNLSSIRRLPPTTLLAAMLLGPALFLAWSVFGRLKLLIALVLPLAAVASQKLYVPPTSSVAIPPRENR